MKFDLTPRFKKTLFGYTFTLIFLISVSIGLQLGKEQSVVTKALLIKENPFPTQTPRPKILPLPSKKVLKNDYHIFQTFNNCGPASLSIALSYYNINVTQKNSL